MSKQVFARCTHVSLGSRLPWKGLQETQGNCQHMQRRWIWHEGNEESGTKRKICVASVFWDWVALRIVKAISYLIRQSVLGWHPSGCNPNSHLINPFPPDLVPDCSCVWSFWQHLADVFCYFCEPHTGQLQALLLSIMLQLPLLLSVRLLFWVSDVQSHFSYTLVTFTL